ncbi:anti-sigma factor family protein [Sphaerotilus uruguayifluvii]|uniref:Anti-sigma factor RsiW n=1 Tax=Sphaerotilus uruguayifluvii TaxID=2735897 RepID=A0ABX2G2U0_9BURK|nr:anti-sigma factor [Leptothrix sp. C29]NRT56613.1 anti-sigma factor RsiW [Leptothrix sp. C29]
MDDDELSALIRQQATRHRADDRLRAAVQTRIALHAAQQPLSGQPPTGAGSRAGAGRMPAWRPVLAGMLAGAVLSWASLTLLPPWLSDTRLPDALVTDHVRSLQPGMLIQVASSDRHTVKPWFQGRIDYAPPVPDLSAGGFHLAGGRLEPLEGAQVAVLVYTYREHVLNVYVRPAGSVQAAQHWQRRGFNLRRWSAGAFQVWLVSDADAARLQQFEAAWRAALGAT